MFLLKIDFNELIWNLDCPGFKQNLVKVKDVCHPLSSEMSDYDLDHWGNILDLSNEKLARIFVNTLEVIFIHSKTVFESSQYLNGSIPSILDLFLKYEPYRNPTKNSDFLYSHGPLVMTKMNSSNQVTKRSVLRPNRFLRAIHTFGNQFLCFTNEDR